MAASEVKHRVLNSLLAVGRKVYIMCSYQISLGTWGIQLGTVPYLVTKSSACSMSPQSERSANECNEFHRGSADGSVTVLHFCGGAATVSGGDMGCYHIYTVNGCYIQ